MKFMPQRLQQYLPVGLRPAEPRPSVPVPDVVVSHVEDDLVKSDLDNNNLALLAQLPFPAGDLFDTAIEENRKFSVITEQTRLYRPNSEYFGPPAVGVPAWQHRGVSPGAPSRVYGDNFHALDLTPSDVRFCRAMVQRVSGLTVQQMPRLILNLDQAQFKEALTQGKLPPVPLERRANRTPPFVAPPVSINQVFNTIFAPPPQIEGAWIPTANAIVLNPNSTDLWPYVSHKYGSVGARDCLLALLTHELTHAAQAQNFSDLLAASTVFNKARAEVKWPTITLARLLADVWHQKGALLEALARTYLIDTREPIAAKYIFEGHARWVERRVQDNLFGQAKAWKAAACKPTTEGKSFFVAALLRESKFLDPYELGNRLFDQIYALQHDLEASPFQGLGGRLFELAPSLRGHGLAHEVLRRPSWFYELLPDFSAAWRPRNRARIELSPLRTWATQHADNEVLTA